MASKVPDEVEVKLTVACEADLLAIGRLTELGAYSLWPIDAGRLHSLYLDTEDFALARHGVALRARRSRECWELTAKWRGETDGEIHRRPELTVPLAEAPTAPFRLDDPTLRQHLASLIAGRPLAPILITDIFRRRIALVRTGTTAEGGEPLAEPLAEIALDDVHLHNGPQGPQERYFEVEIEQLAGSVDDLRNAADLLRQRFNLVPSAESKFSRGMALLYGSDWSSDIGID